MVCSHWLADLGSFGRAPVVATSSRRAAPGLPPFCTPPGHNRVGRAGRNGGRAVAPGPRTPPPGRRRLGVRVLRAAGPVDWSGGLHTPPGVNGTVLSQERGRGHRWYGHCLPHGRPDAPGLSAPVGIAAVGDVL